MSSAVSTSQRFTSTHPCPVCGGHAGLPSGHGARCYGYLSEDGKYPHCTRPEYARGLKPDAAGTFAHYLGGPCRCGATHGTAPPIAGAKQSGRARRVVRERCHDIRDVAGKVVAVHKRKYFDDGSKDVWWEQPNGRRGLGGIKAVDLPLYGIHELGNAGFVVACEGEPARDALASIGIPAVATVCGAKTTPCLDVWRSLLGRDVLLWPDADDDGVRHRDLNLKQLAAIGHRSVRVIDWPDAPDKADAADFVATGASAEDVRGLMANARAFAADATDGTDHDIVWSRFSEIEEEAIRWIWRDWIAAGKLHLLAGVQGDGKSTVLAAIMAMLSSGKPLPDGSRVDARRIGFLISEDGVPDTVLPRLNLHGANLNNIVYIKCVRTDDGERPISLSDDRERIRRFVVQNRLDVLCVDALSDFMGSAKRNDDGEVRAVLTPLGQMGNDAGCAVIGIVHLGKPGASPRRAIERVLGSGAFTQVARIVWAVSVDPDDDTRRYLGHIKNNLAPEVPTFAWHRDRDQPIGWDGVAGTSVKNVMSGSHEKASKVDVARSFLEDFLKGGAKPAKDVLDTGKARGIGRNVLYQAADDLDVAKDKDTREPNGRTYWRLPAGSPPPLERERSSVRSVSSTTTVSSGSKNGHGDPELTQLPDVLGVTEVASDRFAGVATGGADVEDEEAF